MDHFANLAYEDPDIKIIICRGCLSHLCLSEYVISDKFTGGSGPACLVDTVVNIELDPLPQKTEMHTGTYLINKIMCHQCRRKLGWYYRKAYSYEQHYKEGKYVIENKFVRFIPNNQSTQVLERTALLNQLKRHHNISSISRSKNTDGKDRGIKNLSPRHKMQYFQFPASIAAAPPLIYGSVFPRDFVHFEKPYLYDHTRGDAATAIEAESLRATVNLMTTP